MVQPTSYIDCDVPPSLPILMLKSTVLFPLQVLSLQVATKPNLELLKEHKDDDIVGAGTFVDPDGAYVRKNISNVGIACRVLSHMDMGGGTMQIVVQGLRRIEVVEITTSRPYLKARVECVEETDEDSTKESNLITRVTQLVEDLVAVDEAYPEELVRLVKLNRKNPSRCADLIADTVQFSYAEKRELLGAADVSARLSLLADLLRREVARGRVSGEIKTKTQMVIHRGEREAFLRQELEVIRAELDELDPGETEIEQLETMIGAAGLPPLVTEEAHREVQRLHSSEVRSLEGSSIKTFIQWLLAFPWEETTKERISLRRARRMLDDRYFSLGSARDRLLEFLAVRKLRGSNRLPILAVVGPPGTGRTSLARTVAEILGRRFVHIPMQGIHDATEIVGSPRVDASARPGRILDGLRAAGARNPVIAIDEIDRVDRDGDAGGTDGWPVMPALLSAIDPVRNRRFLDRYLGVPFDLSDVLFVITANVVEEIPDTLADVVFVIELSGYTERVKLAIAREYIWPRAVEDHGLDRRYVKLTSAALRRIIQEYTHEAGVRQLTTQIQFICRRLAVKVAGNRTRRLSVGVRNLESYLGKAIYRREDEVAHTPQLGTAMGLAWTESGGVLLPVEALLMPGEGYTNITGLLGEVMEESVEAALSYVRAHSRELEVPPDIFGKMDLHVHFPEGAIPKDGPSAGIAAATAIASLATGRAVRADVAMTGEISLRGRVLPVGGIREKFLAAYRAGIRHVILPTGNESDLVEVPKEVRGKLRVHLVSEAMDVFSLALVKTR